MASPRQVLPVAQAVVMEVEEPWRPKRSEISPQALSTPLLGKK
jgi:hypothetical protein